MRKRRFVSALLSFLLLLSGAVVWWFDEIRLIQKYYLRPCPEKGPVMQEDFPIYLERVDMKAYATQIESLKSAFDIHPRAQVLYENKTYPIFEIIHAPKSAKRTLVVFAVTHGNEFATALVVPRLLENIQKKPKVYESWKMVILTPINPVGLVYQSRYAQNGCDINRDFKAFKTQGAQVQRDAIKEHHPDLIVSLHEGPHKDYFFIATQNFAFNDLKTLTQKLQEKGVRLAKKSFLGLQLKHPGLMHEGFWINVGRKMSNIHTLGRFAATQHIGVITSETPWANPNLDERIQPHLALIEALVNGTVAKLDR